MIFLTGCAGMKVVNPSEQNPEAGTKMVDWSGGKPKIVETYSCSHGTGKNRITALGKTEIEAREEALAKCRDRTVVSFCSADKITCVKN
ncbi:MAG TPA: hypothetical protein VFV50_06880 [Bdellovibrionales bacterium]|nr:hypothetical protein [Bdellovibrionales bacterium]